MPTPNRGNQAAALGKLQWAIRIMEQVLPMIGVETEVGKDVMKALTNLAKHVPAGSSSPGVDQSALQELMIKARQEQPQTALLRTLGQGQGSPGAAPAPSPQPSAA